MENIHVNMVVLSYFGWINLFLKMTNVVPSVTKIRIPCDQTRYDGKIGKLKNMKGSPCYMVKRLDHSHILIDGDLKRKAILKERCALQQGQCIQLKSGPTFFNIYAFCLTMISSGIFIIQ
ncbi:hypothetical protein MAR_027183 [Mya arenaria]|uniref:Uncharacterized protein n=1 Tax=Mya arenaria TaxID=6604 RepID=A0ABY7ESR9_MYAAR|nr:hypothetical protein MAR_027183 [Mya arenaria]